MSVAHQLKCTGSPQRTMAIRSRISIAKWCGGKVSHHMIMLLMAVLPLPSCCCLANHCKLLSDDVTWLPFASSCWLPIEFACRKPVKKPANGDHVAMGCCNVIISSQAPWPTLWPCDPENAMMGGTLRICTTYSVPSQI